MILNKIVAQSVLRLRWRGLKVERAKTKLRAAIITIWWCELVTPIIRNLYPGLLLTSSIPNSLRKWWVSAGLILLSIIICWACDIKTYRMFSRANIIWDFWVGLFSDFDPLKKGSMLINWQIGNVWVHGKRYFEIDEIARKRFCVLIATTRCHTT